MKGLNARGILADAEHLCSADIPSGHVGQCAAPFIFVFNTSWPANALSSMTTSGGKNAGSPVLGSFFQASQALLEEAFPPLRDDLARQVQLFADLLVLEAVRCQQRNLGAHDVTIR